MYGSHRGERSVQRYNPLKAPDPKEWLELDEQERIGLLQDYHRRARIRLPNEKLHATIHAIVETQIALGDETPERRIAQRLIGEGLDRHDAIHAIGMVLAEHMNDMLKTTKSAEDPNAPYFAALERLTRKIGGGWVMGSSAPIFGPERPFSIKRPFAVRYS
jgi:hypothetical protein